MLENLRETESIPMSERVYDVMLKVDRKNFVDRNAYVDSPQGIGYGVTISAPHMHAAALEMLKDHLKPGNTALDVGSGSGYLTACMSLMVGPEGRVVGIDHIDELVKGSEANMRKDPLTTELMESGRVKFVTGDGRLGYPDGGPYDAIHVGAAAPDTPHKLIEQLKPGGRLVSPVGKTGFGQSMMQYEKKADGTVESKSLMSVIYVPLTDREQQWPSSGAAGRDDL